jgi:hypothetical protein
MTSWKTLLAVAAACSLAVAGVAGLLRDGPENDGVVHGSAYPRWPSETLTDWAGFADQVSIARVSAEEQLPQPPATRESGSGYVGRRVVMDIESTVWRRPGAPQAASSVSVLVDGWWAHENELSPYAETGSKRIEVGDRVLVPLVRASDGWSVLSSGSVFPVASSKIAPEEEQLAGNPLAATLRSKSPADVARLLATTRLGKAAVANAGADPDERARRVWAEQLRTLSENKSADRDP